MSTVKQQKPRLPPLPTFEDIRSKVVRGESLTPVEQYIYNNEPASVEQCAEFRIALHGVLDYAYQYAFMH